MPHFEQPQGVVTTEQLAAVFRAIAEKGGEMDENALKLKDAWLAGRMDYMQNAQTLHERLARRLVIAEEMRKLQLVNDARDMLEDILVSAEENGEEEVAEDARRALGRLPVLH